MELRRAWAHSTACSLEARHGHTRPAGASCEAVRCQSRRSAHHRRRTPHRPTSGFSVLLGRIDRGGRGWPCATVMDLWPIVIGSTHPIRPYPDALRFTAPSLYYTARHSIGLHLSLSTVSPRLCALGPRPRGSRRSCRRPQPTRVPTCASIVCWRRSRAAQRPRAHSGRSDDEPWLQLDNGATWLHRRQQVAAATWRRWQVDDSDNVGRLGSAHPPAVRRHARRRHLAAAIIELRGGR